MGRPSYKLLLRLMRYPIFRPAIEQPICRKSKAYVTEAVESGRADWIDSSKKHLGIMLRARMLFARDAYQAAVNSGERSGFDTAWSIRQSGYAGPLCWQLKTSAISA